jgi:hypothetical protein
VPALPPALRPPSHPLFSCHHTLPPLYSSSSHYYSRASPAEQSVPSAACQLAFSRLLSFSVPVCKRLVLQDCQVRHLFDAVAIDL